MWILKNINTNEEHKIACNPFIIGRDARANLTCYNLIVSKEQAVITDPEHNSEEFLYIRNKGTNGTYVNNRRLGLGVNCIIKDGDEIGLALCREKEGYPEAFDEPFYIFTLKKQSKEVKEIKKKEPSLEEELLMNLHQKCKSISDSPEKLEKLEIVKSENVAPKCSNVTTSKEYSDEDHVIIIDSDGDNNPFDSICSQFFVKQEAIDHAVQQEEGIDLDKIKKELEEMNKFDDIHEMHIVDLDNESVDGNRMSESQLLAVLDRHEEENIETITKEKHIDNIENYNEENFDTDRQGEVISESAEIIPAKRRKLSLNNTGGKIDDVKLNNVLKNLKARQNPKSPLQIRAPVRKIDKEKCKIARQEKLKELATKEAQEQSNKEQKLKKTSRAKVKVSSGRGLFLLEPTPSCSSMKPKVAVNKALPKALPKIPKKKLTENDHIHSNNGPLESLNDTMPNPRTRVAHPTKSTKTTKTHNITKTVLVEHSSKTDHSKTKRNNAHSNANGPQKMPSKTSNAHAHANAHAHIEQRLSTGKPGKAGKPTDPRLSPHIPHQPFYEQFEDVVYSLLRWNLSWFETYKHKRVIPPKITKKALVRLSNTFENFIYYKNTFEAFLMVDLWGQIYRDYHNTQYLANNDRCASNTFAAAITEIHKKDKYAKLICFTYIDARQLDAGEFLKEKNIVVVTVDCGQDKRRVLKTMFGVNVWSFVSQISETEQIDVKIAKTCKSTKMLKLEFMIIVNVDAEINKDYHVYGRYFRTFGVYLRLFDAINKVNGGLQKHILQPDPIDYYVEKVPPLEMLPIKNHNLNEDQHQIVSDAAFFSSVPYPGIFLIEGPPGTGKSFVIINIILQILSNDSNQTILLLAPSNAAVDYLIQKIVADFKPLLLQPLHKALKLVRVGAKESINPKVSNYCLEELVKQNLRTDLFNQQPQVKNDYNILTSELTHLRDKKNRTHQEEQKLMDTIRHVDNFVQNSMRYQYKHNFRDMELKVLSSATVICSTIGSCHRILVKNYNTERIKCCIIDEATQANEPESLIPLTLGVEKLILVGDTQQLPAVSTMVPTELEFNRSLFARIKFSLDKYPDRNPIRTLTCQYRMTPEICDFPNKTFYNGSLSNHAKCRKGLDCLKPYAVFALDASQKATEYTNVNEVDSIYGILSAIGELLDGTVKDQIKEMGRFTIGIITPYNDQRKAVNEKLKDITSLRNIVDVTCNTVDSFQGQEKDIILLSCVRNLGNSFLNDKNRLNVAITRAKSALYILASQSLFQTSPILQKLKKDSQKRKVYLNLTKSPDVEEFKNLLKR